MLRKIGVSNYRTFKEPFTVELAPITILLGANSSGKSSITRLPPLLAQSLSERTSAPISWVSETMDFGSFVENVHGHDAGGKICITLSGDLTEVGNPLNALGFPSWPAGPFEYAVEIEGREGDTKLHKITVKIYGQEVSFQFDPIGWINEIGFNGRAQKEIARNVNLYSIGGMFRTLYLFQREDQQLTNVSMDYLKKEVAKILRKYCHANTADAAISKILSFPRISSISSTMDWLKARSRAIPSLHKKFDQITDQERSRIWLLLFISGFDSLSTTLRSSISGDVSSGGYLAPVRAAAQRYYRRRELAVDKIDPSGENLAMYLNSLNYMELDEINSDLENFFDHKVTVHRSEGHISLRIHSGDSYEDNLADVGFGFSQLIPVIAQVHAASRTFRGPKGVSSNRATAPIISVEQPELHLHPAFQSQLGAYFANAATKGRRGNRFRFLIETHSEPLVNEIASLVARGEISQQDVKIYLFERVPGTNTTRVIEANLQSDGRLLNWPFGFFSSGKLPPSNNNRHI